MRSLRLKIPRYRMGFYRYDLKKPIIGQLAELKPVFQEIAAMNREVGIAGIYQNHCGAHSRRYGLGFAQHDRGLSCR